MHLDDIQIVVISLDRRPDRWAAFLERGRAAGLENKVQRLSAVDAKEFDRPAHEHPSITLLTAHNIMKGVRRSHHEIDKAGAIGCSLSHFKAWKHLADSSAPAIIVFEDDAEIPPDFKDRMKAVLTDLDGLDSQWDLITFYNTEYAGGTMGCKPDPAVSPFSSCQSLMGAHAYMLSRRGAQRLLSRAYPIEMHVDAYMAYMARMNHIVMLWHPRMTVIQEFDDSDINHGDQGILNVPTNMEKQGIVALDMSSVLGLMTMAAIVGGLVSLAYVVRR